MNSPITKSEGSPVQIYTLKSRKSLEEEQNVPDSMKMNEYQDVPLDNVKNEVEDPLDPLCYNPLNYNSENEYEDTEVFDSRLQELEDEQEQLNSSLISLTSHFAQVQLRLKQIVAASDDEKEALLKELEEFAFRGIPDTREPTIDFNGVEGYERDDDQRWIEQRKKQKELIAKLKEQLLDLEQYAYETGELTSIPSSILLERQSVVIEQLKNRLSLNLEVMDKLGPEELRKHVDQAIRDLMNPVIMREQLVDQLKTQVTDLERYIQYLHQKQEGLKCVKNSNGDCTCDCPIHGNSQTGIEKYSEFVAQERKRKAGRGAGVKYGSESGAEAENAAKIMKRVVTLLQMITFAQFGCNSPQMNRFDRERARKNSKGTHWGDLRARLEMAIEKIVELDREKLCNDSDYTSDSDDNVFVAGNCEKMTAAVRKDLAPALKRSVGTWNSSNEPVGKSIANCQSSPGLDLFLNQKCFFITEKNDRMGYAGQNGDSYSSCPARRLSQSFNLKMIGGVSVSPKQSLLTTIYDIIESHTPLKRSADSHFKAFVSRALNEGKLILWLRLIVKNRRIVEAFYEPWSYTASTGFDDSLQSLEKLSGIKFDVPIDLAVRQLKNISEAF